MVILEMEKNLVNGKKSGKGFLMRKNGEKYDGIFEDDLFNGKGIFTKENGDVIHGIWKDGELFEEIESKDIKKVIDGD